MLDAFRIQPFDLEPVLASWADPPRFLGKPKKDLPVNDWLAQIKAGCIVRKVPKECWQRVGEHFLGDKAKARFEEVKLVMQNMHGGKYKWNWKNFKVAMRNMGWDIEADQWEIVNVQSKPSGLWWIAGRGSDSNKEAKDSSPTPPPLPPKPQRSNTFKGFPIPKRSSTTSSIETVTSSGSSSSKNTSATTPANTPSTTPAGTPGDTTTTIAQAPLWLMNVCQSLDFLTTEHPKVMTAISAVLITVGSLPALPAISAGAGGAFLASTTAHALGSIAVGLGTLLKASSDGQVQIAPAPHAHP
ncbi:hypothetical protein BKA93DRAFT_727632 [Sparassis latifolia]